MEDHVRELMCQGKPVPIRGTALEDRQINHNRSEVLRGKRINFVDGLQSRNRDNVNPEAELDDLLDGDRNQARGIVRTE